MSDNIIDFPGGFNGDTDKGGYAFGCDEGDIIINAGDTPLTIASALSLLDRCAIMIKKQAGWL